MSTNFSALSSADFEDLGRDLIGKLLSIRFEAFGPGPDGGIDGHHSAGGHTTILQAKHYELSSFAGLAGVMRRSRKTIDKLSPTRYILVTSRHLTPRNKASLAKIIGPSLRSEDDVAPSFYPRLSSLWRLRSVGFLSRWRS
ncbi:MAG: restriction endonuclease [Asticcacaulis sp.]|uniref:restriction endonuclease n=1 Tax=Asticcacaulis sp. TaxID=1872648 RepID=UPI003F7BEA3C